MSLIYLLYYGQFMYLIRASEPFEGRERVVLYLTGEELCHISITGDQGSLFLYN